MPPIASQLIAGLGESWEEKAEGDGMHDYDIRSKIGLRIKELRAERGVSQEEFANLIGMSRSYFGEVETGKRNVAAVNLEKIAKGLGVSLAEFFDSEFFGEQRERNLDNAPCCDSWHHCRRMATCPIPASLQARAWTTRAKHRDHEETRPRGYAMADGRNRLGAPHACEPELTVDDVRIAAASASVTTLPLPTAGTWSGPPGNSAFRLSDDAVVSYRSNGGKTIRERISTRSWRGSTERQAWRTETGSRTSPPLKTP